MRAEAATGSGADHTFARRPLLESPSDYLLVAVLGVAAFATVGTWLVGQVAGFLFPPSWPPSWPAVNPGDGLRIATRLPSTWSDPRQAWPPQARNDLPGLIGFILALLIVVTVVVAVAVWVLVRLGRSRTVRGFASPAQVKTALSAKAALARVERLRPGLEPAQARALDVGVDLGTAVQPAGAGRVVAPIDTSVLLLAAPRIGKTSQVIIPWLSDWPGPALTTSVRADVARATLALRAQRGPVHVLDLTGTRWPTPLRWSPTAGCEEFDVARLRADVMVTVGKAETGPTDSTNAAFFGLTATNLLSGWLHAAALTGRSMGDVLTWALDERLDEPIRLLRDHPRAAPGVAGMLDNIYRSPAETRSNMWTTVLTAVTPLLSTVARNAFTPTSTSTSRIGSGTVSFDIEGFLRESGTVYLIVPEQQASDLAPIISAFVDEIIKTVARLANQHPTGRLDPPLGLLLDEVANVSPLPHLPQLMSYAAGTGIFGVAVLQNLAQARHRWGRDGADMLWGASTVKIALGGLTGDELQDLSRLAGQYRETITTAQYGGSWGAGGRGTSLQTGLQDRPVISPEQIRTLSEADREALILHATTPPVITRMVRHHEGPRAADYTAAAAALTQRGDTITWANNQAADPGSQLASDLGAGPGASSGVARVVPRLLPPAQPGDDGRGGRR